MSKKSKLAAIIVTTGAVILVSLVAVFLMGWASIDANDDVLSYHVAIGQLEGTLSTLKDAETGQRGYLLTGEEKYLQPYDRAVTQLPQELKALHAEAKTGEVSADEIALLLRLTSQKLAELHQAISVRRAQGLPAALAIVETDFGKNTMDSIRAVVAHITAQQEAALASANRRADRFVGLRILVIGLSALLSLVVLIWAYRRIRDESASREKAAMEILRQKELLDVTLASIGDGVIVTDVAGRITFLNEVAEKLTGWTSPQAVQQPCAKVFNIINESSRQVVDSPVDKVLSLGRTIGLANHTLLIRRDGSEIPIDDSGAPIKEPDGTIHGVALIFRDFSEHKAAERKLIEANHALEAANQAKDQFLAALSHELRTPLTPVLATLTSWEASDELPGSFLADIQMLRRNIDLEARLIDDLLDLNRIVKGKLSLNLELVDAHELVKSVVTMFQSEINAKQLNVSIELKAARHYVKADSARLHQVFGNILNNATKFTERHGHISIVSKDDTEGRIILKLKDDGIGMSPKEMDRLFQPFEQGADISNRYGGLGLGMAISRALVELHAGVITAESEGPGHGAEFTVTLPSIHASTMKLPTMTGSGLSARADLRGIRILLIEDHKDSAEVISHLLRNKGYFVEACATVTEALKIANEREFNLVLSDIGLPDGTGIDLIRRLRQRSSIPAVALTGFGMDEDIHRYKEAGFDAHLTKPVNFQKLEMLIHQFFSENGR
ncbi:MAG TPA: CHASE3 domain-containing protein [Candidatus Binataceae bacterium]|nr:CHASE3 domain-containing protein [Candidatus Binataceae bacterium]